MRLTKKTLRETKRSMNRRVNELCAIMATGGLRAEWERCFPGFRCEMGTDAEVMRSLLSVLLDDALPDFWMD